MKETDCGAVKLEGGRRMAETIRYLVDRGIPVMSHIGLTPQSINVLGGFKTQGRHARRVGGPGGGRPAGRRGGSVRGRDGGDRGAVGGEDHGAMPSRQSASAPRPLATGRSW